jgi:hypothetical protein
MENKSDTVLPPLEEICSKVQLMAAKCTATAMHSCILPVVNRYVVLNVFPDVFIRKHLEVKVWYAVA